MAQEITYALFDATYRVAASLGIVTESVATGGSTTTLEDTVALTQDDDYWNDGTVWILRDSLEAGAAPEGEYAVVTDFASADDKATFAAMTAAVASGDRYAIAKKRYPLHRLIGFVNEALTDMGTIQFTDTTSLDTETNKSEYTLPVAASYDLREVWIETREDSDDNRWHKIDRGSWYIQKTASGTGDLLVLLPILPISKDLKLVYVGEHPRLDDYNDSIDESVHINRVVNAAVLRALIWRKQKVGMGDPTLDDQIQYYTGRAITDESRFPIRRVSRPSKYLVLGGYVDKNQLRTPTV